MENKRPVIANTILKIDKKSNKTEHKVQQYILIKYSWIFDKRAENSISTSSLKQLDIHKQYTQTHTHHTPFTTTNLKFEMYHPKCKVQNYKISMW